MMKLNYVLAFIIMMFSHVVYAQKFVVSTEKSSIEWFGKKIGGQHEGNIKVQSGYFELVDEKIVTGEFIVDMTTITNSDLKNEGYNQKLVGHLKSDDFFGVEKFPTASFNVVKSSKFSDGKATVTGDLTIKGKTDLITFEVERERNMYSAKINIDRSKFDVKYGSNSFFDNLGDRAINDIFTLDINLSISIMQPDQLSNIL